MKTLLIALAFVTFTVNSLPSAEASFRQSDLLGTYIGCGNLSALGERKVAFHLVEMSNGLDGRSTLTGSLGWADINGKFNSLLAFYFTKVQADLANGRFFMKLEIPPKRDYGTILKTLLVQVQKDGSIKGKFQANSMQADGSILHGEFTAHRLPTGTSPEQFVCR